MKGVNEIILNDDSVRLAIQLYLNDHFKYECSIRVTSIMYYKNSRRIKAVFEPPKPKSEIEKLRVQLPEKGAGE